MNRFFVIEKEKNSFLLLLSVLAGCLIVWQTLLAGLFADIASREMHLEENWQEIALYSAFAAKYREHRQPEAALRERYAVLSWQLPREADINKYLQGFYMQTEKLQIKVNDVQIKEKEKFDKNVNFIPVKINCSGDYFKVLQLLHYLEGSKQRLNVTKVSIDGDENSGNITLNCIVQLYSQN